MTVPFSPSFRLGTLSVFLSSGLTVNTVPNTVDCNTNYLGNNNTRVLCIYQPIFSFSWNWAVPRGLKEMRVWGVICRGPNGTGSWRG